jgi:hypothetical protein
VFSIRALRQLNAKSAFSDVLQFVPCGVKYIIASDLGEQYALDQSLRDGRKSRKRAFVDGMEPPATAAMETGKSARAEITFVSPATRIDPKIQGVSFFYAAAAESGVLPGMNVLAFLPSGRSIEGVAVPASAIVWWQGRAWVYRRTGQDTFTRVAIATDLPAPGGGYMANDVAKDAEIVTHGAQLLLSEEFRSQIQVEEGPQ